MCGEYTEISNCVGQTYQHNSNKKQLFIGSFKMHALISLVCCHNAHSYWNPLPLTSVFFVGYDLLYGSAKSEQTELIFVFQESFLVWLVGNEYLIENIIVLFLSVSKSHPVCHRSVQQKC